MKLNFVSFLPPEKHLVFVYGTLLGGEDNDILLKGSKFVSSGWTKSIFTLLDNGVFPAIRKGGSQSIRGEVYEVDDMILRRLDRLEGTHASYYKRTVEEIQTRGEKLYAFVYIGDGVLNGNVFKWTEILKGDYKNRIKIDYSHGEKTNKSEN